MDSLYPSSLGLVLLSCLLLIIALYGWRSAPDAVTNRRFAMQTIVVTWWDAGIAGLHSGPLIEFWGHWTFTAATLMPLAFLHFAEAFPAANYAVSALVKRSIVVVSTVFAIVASATPWIAHSFVIRDGVLMRSSGPLMPVFILFFLSTTAVIFIVLAKKWGLSSGLARAQLRLYFVGLLLFCIGGVSSNLILPVVVGDSRYSTLGPCFVLVFLAFVAHGIIRHRFMNLRLVIHNWLTASIASLISVVPLLIALSLAAGTVAIVLAGLLAAPLWTAARFLLHRYVYRGDADFRTLISAASESLSRVLSPLATANVTVDTIVAAVRPESVAIYIRHDDDQRPTLMHSSHARLLSAAPDVLPEALARAFGSFRNLASPNAVATETGMQLPADVVEVLETSRWALVLPFIAEEQLIGAVAIGVKLSGDPYYLEDVELLQALGSQASVAFNNGQLYERVLLANQHIHNIVATIQSGIVVADSRGRARLLNDASIRLLGLPDTLRPPTTISLSELPSALVALLRQSLTCGPSETTVDLVIPEGPGGTPVMCSTAPLRKAAGEIIGVVAAISDLSTLRALDIERRRAERLNYYETLAAALAHEIANPIAPIKALTQLLPERPGDRAFLASFTKTVLREIGRIETFVGRLRSLSGPLHRDRVPVNLHEALRNALDVMEPLFANRRVSLTVTMCDEDLTVCGDIGELHELFLNLLTNALEATAAELPVFVEINRESTAAQVRISDSGPGISPEIADRMFEPFVSSKQRGSGLGLALCRGIVERHGGSIWARNTDRGARFTVTLPLA
jgi:signal transduction histidine kinase